MDQREQSITIKISFFINVLISHFVVIGKR